MLENLGNRANVIIRRYGNKLIIIYDDHRWLLNVLFKFYKDNGGVAKYNIVTFDAHDDAADCELHSEMLKHIGVRSLKDATEKQFGAFVDFDIRNDDGNWLSVACELDLINNSCTIGNRCVYNIEQRHNQYVSESGKQHHMFELSEDIEAEIGARGKLGDLAKTEEYKEIRAFFDCSHEKYIGDQMAPFILDFDLDFFTISLDDDLIAWPSKIWQKKFGYYSKGKLFIDSLINKAEVITICREPDYCGSIGESNKILEMLDTYFFKHQLGTALPY